jgi:hypothetical protein
MILSIRHGNGNRNLLECRDYLRETSDSNDSNFTTRCPYELFYILPVACENDGIVTQSDRDHSGVNDIRRSGPAEQAPCFMGLALAKGHNRATALVQSRRVLDNRGDGIRAKSRGSVQGSAVR